MGGPEPKVVFALLLLISGPWYGPSCRKQPCLNHCRVP